MLLWGTVGRLSDPLVDRPDVQPEVHALYLLDAYGMGSAGASCFCAFRVGQLRRVDQLDDLHTAVYKAPLDSKRTQPNCFERGQRNPHGLEQAILWCTRGWPQPHGARGRWETFDRGQVTGAEPEVRFPGEPGRDLRPGADKTAPPLSLPRVVFHRAPGRSFPGPTGTAFTWSPAC